MSRSTSGWPPTPPIAEAATVAGTRRQRLIALLRGEEWSFDELRHELGLTVKILEEDLRHVERTIRASGAVFGMRPAICRSCDFVFTKRALHPPGRCPQCRDRRIDGPFFSLEG